MLLISYRSKSNADPKNWLMIPARGPNRTSHGPKPIRVHPHSKLPVQQLAEGPFADLAGVPVPDPQAVEVEILGRLVPFLGSIRQDTLRSRVRGQIGRGPRTTTETKIQGKETLMSILQETASSPGQPQSSN